MEPIKHPHCNTILRKPDGMTEDECRDLHICRQNGCVWSFWKPNDEELAALVVGGSVALLIMGETHPPLSIHAALPTEPFNGALTVEESLALSRTIRERNQALMDITKRIVAAWVRTSADSPERRRLVDEFLDLSTLNHGLNEIVRAVPVHEWAEQTIAATDAERYRTDALGYRADAEHWKGEAERWRKVAEKANDYKLAAIGAEDALQKLSKAIDPEGVSISLVDEVAALKDKADRFDRLQASVDSVIDQLNRVSVTPTLPNSNHPN